MHDKTYMDTIYRLGTRVFVRKEQNIYDQGNVLSVPFAYYLEKGVCALTSLTKKGDEEVYLYFKAGRMIGFTQLLVNEYEKENYYSEYLIKAKTDCVIYKINEELFRRMLAGDPEFNSRMLGTLTQNYVDVLNRFHQMQEESATTRLCRFLLTHSEYCGGKLLLPKYFTYVEMARYLGAHPVTVARIMAKLKQEGAISKIGHCVAIERKEQIESFLNNSMDLEY